MDLLKRLQEVETKKRTAREWADSDDWYLSPFIDPNKEIKILTKEYDDLVKHPSGNAQLDSDEKWFKKDDIKSLKRHPKYKRSNKE